MDKSLEKIDWTQIRIVPWDDMATICCACEDYIPDHVFITEYDYRRLTEAGVVNTIFDQVYDVFGRETDPSWLIAFIRWQMDKLDRYEARYLREYIHFSLKHDMVGHPYREAWQRLADDMRDYAQKLERKCAGEKKIVYVCPGEDYRVYCLFCNGQWRVWDASCMLKMQPMKHHMEKDPNFFRNAIAVINDTLAWDRTGDRDPYECININPSTIWNEGAPMSMEEMVKILDSTHNQERKG